MSTSSSRACCSSTSIDEVKRLRRSVGARRRGITSGAPTSALRGGDDGRGVLLRIDVQPHLLDLAVLADEERLPGGERASQRHAERLGHGAVGVDDERERQFVFIDKRLMALGVLRGDAVHREPRGLDIGPAIAEALRLYLAAGGVVLGIEIDEHELAAQAAQLDLAAVLEL